MALVRCIKTFHITKAVIWSIKWSFFGDFLVSCGVDGCIFIWAQRSSNICFNFRVRSVLDRNIFRTWNYVRVIHSKKSNGTYRDLSFSPNDYQFAICSFNGNIDIFKIYLSQKNHSISLKNLTTLKGNATELKECDFSADGSNFIACSRDKIVWNWTRTSSKNFQCIFVLMDHESDIKQICWHPAFGILITATYDGFLRIFRKNNQDMLLIISLKFSAFSIFSMSTDENGNKIIFGTGKGELFYLPFKKNIITRHKLINQGNKNFLFFSIGRDIIHCFQTSKSIALSGLSGDDDSLHILKINNIWAKNTCNILYYQGSKFNRAVFIENSIIRAHLGNPTDIAWHPRNENVMASCGEDSVIRIWCFL